MQRGNVVTLLFKWELCNGVVALPAGQPHAFRHHATKAPLAVMEILTDNASEVFKDNVEALSKLLDQLNAEGQV